jgi:hypothetical protein
LRRVRAWLLTCALYAPVGFLGRYTRDMNGSLQLREYPADLVRLSCEKCGRAGQYRKANLIARYGADIRLPDLREEIAQCERHGKMYDACMVRYG